jgi:hypothetical protein
MRLPVISSGGLLLPHMNMNEWPLPNSVHVIDNALIYRVARFRETGIREMVEERGARLLLSSRQFTRFESDRVLLYQNHGVDQALDYKEGTVHDLFWEALQSITIMMDNVKFWYERCGYNVPK